MCAARRTHWRTPATSDIERVKFRTVNKGTGYRIRYQFVDDATREEVSPENRAKGYEVAKGEYVVVDDAGLEAIELESAHTIDIDSFVPASQIDKRLYDPPTTSVRMTTWAGRVCSHPQRDEGQGHGGW